MARRARELFRSGARVAVLVLAAWAALFAFVGAGKRSYWCPIAQESYDAPPCEGDDRGARDRDVPAIQPRDCCQVKWRPAAPAAETPTVDRREVAPADRVLALSASPLAITSASAIVPFGVVHAVRAGPSPPLPGERRAELMVFHI